MHITFLRHSVGNNLDILSHFLTKVDYIIRNYPDSFKLNFIALHLILLLLQNI